jgi:hypothetical protein
MYLNYFRKEENNKDDNEPIGIILGARKNNSFFLANLYRNSYRIDYK